jgi:hypothetical protein
MYPKTYLTLNVLHKVTFVRSVDNYNNQQTQIKGLKIIHNI